LGENGSLDLAKSIVEVETFTGLHGWESLINKMAVLNSGARDLRVFFRFFFRKIRKVRPLLFFFFLCLGWFFFNRSAFHSVHSARLKGRPESFTEEDLLVEIVGEERQTKRENVKENELYQLLPEQKSNRTAWIKIGSTECERYYGNGFSEEINVCPEVSCRRNPVTSGIYCSFENVRVNTERIKVSKGGEPISAVVNRPEPDEFPVYSKGAFQLLSEECSSPESTQMVKAHFEKFNLQLKHILTNMKGGNNLKSCQQLVNRPTIFVTRDAYANLYHTYCELYQVFLIFQIHRSFEGMDILFFDGHSEGAMDSLWPSMFGITPSYVSSIPKGTCFKKAIFAPVAWSSPLDISPMRKQEICVRKPQIEPLKDFVRAMKSGYGIEVREKAKPIILLICRGDYNPHPRVKSSKTKRKFANEERMFRALQDSFGARFEVKRVGFERLSMAAQIDEVVNANLVIGMHGAALSHILHKVDDSENESMRGLLEIVPPSYGGRIHFRCFSQMANNLPYRSIPAGREDRNYAHIVSTDALVKGVEHLISMQGQTD